jgi:hypothetical protein
VHALAVASAFAVLAASVACQSSSTNVVGPGGEKCAMSLPTNLPSIGPEGGTGTLQINVAAECVWSVSSGAEWIAITSNSSGQGSGTVGFAAASNPVASARRGAVIVSDRRVELMQAAAVCNFSLSPATASVDANGDEGVVNVAVLDGCQWSARTETPWLTIVSGQNGSGAGSVRYRAEANGGDARSGTLTISDRTFAVNQGGVGSCLLAVGKTQQSVPASGGFDTVTVTGGNCPWIAESRVPWISVTGGAAGNGNGSVSLNVAPNPGGARSGVVMIAGYMYLVTQPAAASRNCSYSIDSAGQSIPASGGSANIAVSASGGCNWSAVSHVSWISIVGGSSGSGNGVVTFSAIPNPGPERQGLVTVAGDTHTVTQQAAGAPSCSYAISSSQLSAPAAGASATVAVVAPPGCGWTATSQSGWITVTSGAGGNGNGTVNVSIAANNGVQRSGVVTVAGHTYTVTQSAGSTSQPPPPHPSCTYSISPTNQAVRLDGGNFNVSVTTQPGCSWTVVSQDGWIQITSDAAGTGSGLVSYRIGLLLLGSRSGTLTFSGGNTLTINQSALLLSNDR